MRVTLKPKKMHSTPFIKLRSANTAWARPVPLSPLEKVPLSAIILMGRGQSEPSCRRMTATTSTNSFRSSTVTNRNGQWWFLSGLRPSTAGGERNKHVEQRLSFGKSIIFQGSFFMSGDTRAGGTRWRRQHSSSHLPRLSVVVILVHNRWRDLRNTRSLLNLSTDYGN